MSRAINYQDVRVGHTESGSVVIELADDEFEVTNLEKALDIAEAIANHATLAMEQDK